MTDFILKGRKKKKRKLPKSYSKEYVTCIQAKTYVSGDFNIRQEKSLKGFNDGALHSVFFGIDPSFSILKRDANPNSEIANTPFYRTQENRSRTASETLVSLF